MRIYFILTAILCVATLTVPFLTNAVNKKLSVAATAEATTGALISEAEQALSSVNTETISVLKATSGKVVDVNLFEYTVGAVAGEMPASFNVEALKAQAVACYTYAKYTVEHSDKKDNSLPDISDTSLHQCYIDKEEQKKKWGEAYDEYRSKVEDAVQSVFGEILTCNGKTAMTVFHAVSPDTTNSAEEIWGKAVPYLVSVSAPSDDVPKTVCDFTSEEFKKLFEEKGDIKLTEKDPRTWAKVTEKDENNYIKTLKVGEKSFSAIEVKDILSLPGVSFAGKLENDVFTFTVNGKGHGVGMSQLSAEYMANSGKSYKEILAHFYPRTILAKE